jgi:sigma-B regulation protein RsbU (phosphoserine phosphatase)
MMRESGANSMLFAPKTQPWRERLAAIVETMREMSGHTDPQEMSRAYSARIRKIFPLDRLVTVSRRDLAEPEFRITRNSDWPEPINPWKERDRLPLLSGGLIAKLLYSDEPWIIDELMVEADDPAAEHLTNMGSLLAIPQFDQGHALNMVLIMRREQSAFNHEEFPELVWTSNLYGRATHNLVRAEETRAAYEVVDRELMIVADIQRSLLPTKLPEIPTLGLAASYHTSRRAGGDYYDFFPLPNGQWGILIADVSGHGTPAAVIMAVTHAIAHTYPGPATPPGELLRHVNRTLADKYTSHSGAFVTAFYGIYEPTTRTLKYASAGHPPPRIKRCADGSLGLLDGVRRLPLGVDGSETYPEAAMRLVQGDQIVFYTDGITESTNLAGEMFGLGRLDHVLENCAVGAPDLLKEVLAAVESFANGKPPDDDQTVLVVKVK